MDEDDFYLKVSHALSGCQLVEQQLKLYITEAFDLVRKCLGDKMPFKISGEDYEDSSLEKLIDIFGKLTKSETLVSDLRKFKKERNFLSHKGITHCLDHDGELCQSTAEDFEVRLVAIQKEAHRLYIAIHEEANQFRGHLWFDDLSAG